MRKGCERRRSNEIGITDSCNDLGAMAWTVAPELLFKGFNSGIVGWETIARNCESSLEKNMCCGILEAVGWREAGRSC